MRKKNLGRYTAAALCAALVVSSLAGCASNTSSSEESTEAVNGEETGGSDTESQSESTVYGVVSSISEDSITIKTGTLKTSSDEETSDETDDTADESDETSDEAGSSEEADASSLLDLTGEEQTITLTDDTTYTKQSMGGSSQGGNTYTSGMTIDGETMELPDGEAPDGEMGEMPDGEAPDGEMGEMPDGEAPDGEMGEMPDGEAPSGEAPDGEMGEIPDGEAPDGEMGELPDGEAPDGEMGDGESMELPDGEAPNGDASDGETMELPDGEASDGDTGDGEAMEQPDGEAPDGEAADAELTDTSNTTESEEISLSDISLGDVVMITLDDDGNAEEITVITLESGMSDGMSMGDGSMGGDMGGNMGGDMGSSSSSGVDSYTAVVEYTEDTTVLGETYTSTGTDENAIHIYQDAIVNITNAVVSRISSDSTGGDNSSFYGVGAAILATEGTAYISDSTVETDSAGGAGVFSYGDAVIYVADTTITTEQDTSGGIHVAGGGTLYAWDLDVTTNGGSAAAIRSDRGGGTMVVDGGTYTSNGSGSPAVYCTADIAIGNATLTANGSEAVCIEGLNSLYIFDSDLTGNMSDDSQNDCTWNVILYQSMSGDSEVGNSIFQMVGGSITAKNGGMFYTTNTESTFILSGVDITYADDNEFFLRCTGNNNQRGWGTTGSNGADCSFTAIDQEMEGDVIWDSISQLDFYMTDGSTLTGAFIQDETYAGDGGSGYANLYIDEDSTWVVSGDSVLSALYSAGTIVDADGNTVSIVGNDGTVYVEGDSEYTVTVDDYSETVDLSGATAVTEWSDYEVEKPDELG